MRPMTDQDLIDIRTHFPIEACLNAPDLTITPQVAQDFESLFQETLSKGPAAQVAYHLPQPKYLFLEYLAQKHAVMLHGSPLQALDILKPIRRSRDSREFGDLPAIYATQDPLWGLFFAVLDKSRLEGMIMNGAIQLAGDDGSFLRRYYYCLDAPSLRNNPWKPGAMYVLPGDGFEPDPDMSDVRVGPYRMVCTHWIRRGEVAPLARLLVEPEDFPFYDRVWGYDPEAMLQKMGLPSMAGWPYLADASLYPIRPEI